MSGVSKSYGILNHKTSYVFIKFYRTLLYNAKALPTRRNMYRKHNYYSRFINSMWCFTVYEHEIADE